MSRTYVKGRVSKDKRRGFKRNGWISKCQCSHCSCSSQTKAWKKANERNEIKFMMDEYYSTKTRQYNMRCMKWLIPMTL